MGDDTALLEVVSSANIACGFHAGDPDIMNATVAECVRRGVSIGAHPSFPDLRGFGRRAMDLTADEVRNDVLYQLGALTAFAAYHGASVAHIAPHGRLGNLVATRADYAGAVADAAARMNPGLIVLAQDGELATAAAARRLPVGIVGIADRAYEADGTLVPRGRPGAVIHDPSTIVDAHRPDGLRRAHRNRLPARTCRSSPTRYSCTETPPAPFDWPARSAAELETAGVHHRPARPGSGRQSRRLPDMAATPTPTPVEIFESGDAALRVVASVRGQRRPTGPPYIPLPDGWRPQGPTASTAPCRRTIHCSWNSTPASPPRARSGRSSCSACASSTSSVRPPGLPASSASRLFTAASTGPDLERVAEHEQLSRRGDHRQLHTAKSYVIRCLGAPAGSPMMDGPTFRSPSRG